MPRIIVTTDTPERSDEHAVLLDEGVRSVHLSTGHAAAQLIERIAWAISDAENAENPRARDGQTPARKMATRAPVRRSRARLRLTA
ncbi:MAG TPA: hypothetical protein VKG38_01060 [Solirubrobacteraceae bacterium]|nr:hypothetical protein [Solirubrobacteraceae bacterium]